MVRDINKYGIALMLGTIAMLQIYLIDVMVDPPDWIWLVLMAIMSGMLTLVVWRE